MPLTACIRERIRGWRSAAALAAGLGIALLPSRGGAQAPEVPVQLAYNYGEDETPRAAAMGGALRALGNGTTAMFMNPAAMVETRVYHIEALAQIVPEVGRHVYAGTIVDSVTGRLAGGISVAGGFVANDRIDRSQLNVRIALAYPISERLFVGIGGRYAKVTQEGPGPFTSLDKVSGGLRDADAGAGKGNPRSAFVNTFTFDAGVAVKASDSVYIAALGQNLSYPGHAVLPTSFGGGIGIGTDDFSVEADGLADFNSYDKTSARLMLGAELLLGDHFPLRAGYRFDQGAEVHSLSAGLGYVGREWAGEVSMRRTLDDPGLTHVVIGLAYFLESSGLTRTPTDFGD